MTFFKRLSLAYRAFIGRREGRCLSCNEWVYCPFYRDFGSVAYPCPHYHPLRCPPDWPGWKMVKELMGRGNE